MRENVKVFELDFSNCETWHEVYREIKTKCELPDWCGENLSAMWDAATGIMETPARLVIYKEPKNKGLIPMIEDILKVLKRAQNMYGEITVVIRKKQGG